MTAHTLSMLDSRAPGSTSRVSCAECLWLWVLGIRLPLMQSYWTRNSEVMSLSSSIQMSESHACGSTSRVKGHFAPSVLGYGFYESVDL